MPNVRQPVAVGDGRAVWNLRALGEVLPQEYADHVCVVATAILMSEQSGPVQ